MDLLQCFLTISKLSAADPQDQEDPSSRLGEHNQGEKDLPDSDAGIGDEISTKPLETGRKATD